MGRVRYAEDAQRDLEDIAEVIAEQAPEKALRFLDAIESQCQQIAEHQRMGRARDELDPGIRSLPFERYLILYYPIDDGIDVARILHMARDIEALF